MKKMGLYSKLCYKVEDVFILMLSKKKDPEEIKNKVRNYRSQKEQLRLEKRDQNLIETEERKKLLRAKQAEREKAKQEKEKEKQSATELEHQKTLSLFYHFDQTADIKVDSYEYKAIQKNRPFFSAVKNRIFEADEYGWTFIACEFDKTKTKEYQGYLIVTNKRVWFVSSDISVVEKFRYQTIHNVQWFNDSLIEKGLYIQYGKRRLEFDEIYDVEQMKKVGNWILKLSKTNTSK